MVTSINDRNCVTNLRKMAHDNANLDVVIINVLKKLANLCQFGFKILSENKILTSFKSHKLCY